MAFATDSNCPEPLGQPPPTAYLSASEAASEVPSLLMYPCQHLTTILCPHEDHIGPGGGGGGFKTNCEKLRENCGKFAGKLREIAEKLQHHKQTLKVQQFWTGGTEFCFRSFKRSTGSTVTVLRPAIFRNFPQFRNFWQFPAIFPQFSDLLILRACWCPLLVMWNAFSHSVGQFRSGSPNCMTISAAFGSCFNSMVILRDCPPPDPAHGSAVGDRHAEAE